MFTKTLLFASILLPVGAPVVPAAPSAALRVHQGQDTRFDFSGTCQVRCDGNQCKAVCSSGVVYARDAEEARIKAMAQLRVEAGRQGVVIEGSFSIDVRMHFATREPGDVAAAFGAPTSVAMLAVDGDQAATALADTMMVAGQTIERCSGQLYVEDGCGRRIAVPRGQWVTIDNGSRGDLVWWCGDSQEITRGVCGSCVRVHHSTNDRRIDIVW